MAANRRQGDKKGYGELPAEGAGRSIATTTGGGKKSVGKERRGGGGGKDL